MSDIQQFSQEDMEIVAEKTLYKGFFTLKQIQFKHKLFAGGESEIVTRELLIKGAASAVIAYDPKATSSGFSSFSTIPAINSSNQGERMGSG